MDKKIKKVGREPRRKQGGKRRWGMSREAGLGRNKKTTEREPGREVKREKRGGGCC